MERTSLHFLAQGEPVIADIVRSNDNGFLLFKDHDGAVLFSVSADDLFDANGNRFDTSRIEWEG